MAREKLSISDDFVVRSIENVIQNTQLQGRWQITAQQPLTICDVGHNPAGMQAIINQLLQYKNRKIHFVIGFVNDKDVATIMTMLPKEQFVYYLCCAQIPRALPVEELSSLFQNYHLSYLACDTVTNAYQTATINASPEDIIFVGGSCFVVGDFLAGLPK